MDPHNTGPSPDLATMAQSLVGAGRVPGLSLASTDDGIATSLIAVGVRNADSATPVDVETVFEAASLSKPVVAYAALQLADAGALDLDQPLSMLHPPPVPADPASARITARHVLSHTSGLPNWRGDGLPARAWFEPGTRFSYSGEGFVYLQSVLERIEGAPLDALARRLVFDPLGMESSSFTWKEDFERNFASPHDLDGRPAPKFRPATANAAYSLHTTPADYVRFTLAAASGEGLQTATAADWMSPRVHVPLAGIEALHAEAPALQRDVAWGLGWGLEIDAGTFFHWGSNSGATAFVIGVPRQSRALAVFANADAGLEVAADLVRAFLPGRHAALAWLGLEKQ